MEAFEQSGLRGPLRESPVSLESLVLPVAFVLLLLLLLLLLLVVLRERLLQEAPPLCAAQCSDFFRCCGS